MLSETIGSGVNELTQLGQLVSSVHLCLSPPNKLLKHDSKRNNHRKLLEHVIQGQRQHMGLFTK